MAVDSDRIRHILRHFSFDHCRYGSQGFDRILIQFFGFAGHGKSAFINSCKYVWDNVKYKNYTHSTDIDEGHTLWRRTYPLTENITLVDNRGFGTIGGYETGEIFAQLGNLLPLDEPVQWTKKYELIEKIKQARNNVKISDFVVPVLVYNIKKLVSPEEEGEVKAMLQISETLTGMSPIVVLTHKMSGELVQREATFRNMGVNKIFSIENYTLKDHCKIRTKHEEVLRFLHEVVKDVKFRLDEPRNLEKEMRRRRKYVVIYVKEREKMYKKEALYRIERPDEDIRRMRMREMMSGLDLEEKPLYIRITDRVGGALS